MLLTNKEPDDYHLNKAISLEQLKSKIIVRKAAFRLKSTASGAEAIERPQRAR